MRRALAVAVPLLLAVAQSATAAPSAAPTHGAAAHLQLVGGGRVQDVALLVTTPQQGRPQLRVKLTPGLGGVQRWYGELPATAVTTTGDAVQGTTTLRARVGGLPLTVVWHVLPGAVMVSMGEQDGDASSSEGWGIAGPGGPVDVTLGPTRCSLQMGVVGTAFTYDTAGYGRPLATRLALPRGTTCRDIPNSLPTVP